MKRLISLILILTAISTLVIPVSADSGIFGKYSDKAEVLRALGVVDYSFDEENSDDLISKAAFVDMAVKFMTEEVPNHAYEEILFSDVLPDNEYFAAINYACANGIIDNGNEFYPDRYIDYAEAAKILVRLTGYSAITADNNYEKKAAELKITAGLNTNSGVRYCDAISMFYNCLDLDMPGKDSFSTDSYKLKFEKKVIEYYRGIKRSTGVVSQMNLCAVNGEGKFGLDRNQIVIANEVYQCDYTKPENIFGCNTEFYYTTDNDENIILYIGEYKNSRINVKSFDFINYVNDRFTYYDGERQKYLKISDTVDVIYNWSYCADYDVNDIMLTGLTGNDIFIDNNNDGIYELIIINEYKDYAVSSVDDVNEIIYTKESNSVIDASKNDNLLIIDKEKGEIEISALNADSVISVQQAKSGSPEGLVRIFVSDETIIGNISAWSEEDMQMEIDGSKYDVNASAATRIYPGNRAKVFIDYFGYAAFVDYDDKEVAKTYGFLMHMWVDEDNEEIVAKILKLDGTIESYKLEDKAYIDGNRYRARNVYAKLLDSAGLLKRQIIVYEISSNGKISKIDTQEHGENEVQDAELKVVQCSNVLWKISTGAKANCIDDKYCFAKDAKIFIIPNVSASGKLSDDECRVVNIYDVKKKESRMNVDVVNPDDAGIAKIGVYYYTYSDDINIGGNENFDLYKNSSSYMVYAVRKELNEYDEVKTFLYYYDGFKLQSAEVLDENVVKKIAYKTELADGEMDWIERKSDGSPEYKLLKRGDIIQLYKDDRGIITSVYLNHDSERVDNGRFVSSIWYENQGNVGYGGEFGIVHSKAGNGISIVAQLRDDAQLYNPNAPEKTFNIIEHPSDDVWKPYDYNNAEDLAALRKSTVHSWRYEQFAIIYDSETNEIKNGTFSDIIDYKSSKNNPSLIYMRTDHLHRCAFIYK